MSAALNIGFLPLTDAAPLIAAVDFGFAQAEGLAINLHRDVSWANLRDRLMVGHYDAAHMLAPLALAASLGVGQAKCPLRAPFLLNLNGNGTTLSKRLLEDFAAIGCDPLADWMTAAQGLAGLVRARLETGASRLTLATVHLFSAHTYLLRRFLRAGGLDPDKDVELVVAPPPYYVEAPVIVQERPAVVVEEGPPPVKIPPSRPDPVIYPRNGQSAQQLEADRQDCNRWASTQRNAMGSSGAFNRATEACMDARGYTQR
jgi:ABC-type nitrate/sulfonate/bicarbonate transport system substrate-binding protein